MTSPEQPIAGYRQARSIRTLPNELLAEIFLRLPTPADLAWASATCSSFHLIVADRSFLRRFRAIHPLPLLGFATYDGFHTAQPPHPSAPLARALAAAADFSYAFIPRDTSSSCFTRDIRHGRVLVEFLPEDTIDPDGLIFDRVLVGKIQLAVCDPLYRRYVLIPAIPDELTAQHGCLFETCVLLAPTGEDDEETSFRVICMSWSKTKLFLFVFSSITGQWGIAASPCWGTLGTGVPSSRFSDDEFFCLADARGHLYILLPWSDKLVILDTLSMEFSMTNNVPSSPNAHPRIVVSTDGSLRMVLFNQHNEDDLIAQSHILKPNDGEPSGEWQLENNIPLPGQYTYFILGVTEGFLFLGAHNSLQSLDEYFSLDVKTYELKKVCGMEEDLLHYVVGAYFGFPPSMSEPCL